MSASQPLYDAMIEKALLGAALYSPRVADQVSDLLRAADYGNPHHQAIAGALSRVLLRGQPWDSMSVVQELRASGDATSADAAAVVLTLDPLPMPNPDLVATHCATVRDWALRRQLRSLGERLIARVSEPAATGQAALDELETTVFALGGSSSESADWVNGQAWATELLTHVTELVERKTQIAGVPTGLRDLDDFTRGLKPGELWILGGRPGMGKSVLGAQIAMYAAHRGTQVALASLEMTLLEIGLRHIAARAEVSSYKLQRGYINEEEMTRISDVLAALAASGVHGLDISSISPLELRSRVRRLQARLDEPVGLIVVDYLQQLQPLPEHRRENRTVQVGGISRALKILARELRIPILALCQLSRATEARQDKRPQLSDLRESGSLEQDADTVLLIHRQGYYDDQAPKDSSQLILAKQRAGNSHVEIDLRWHGDQQRFDNPE